MSRSFLVSMALLFGATVGLLSSNDDVHAAVGDPITCSNFSVDGLYNSFNSSNVFGLKFDERSVVNSCATQQLSCADIASSFDWALCNDTAGGQLKVRHEGSRFTNFKLDSGPPLDPDINHLIPAGPHTITYTDSTDNENRTVSFTVNVNEEDIDTFPFSVTTAPPTPPVFSKQFLSDTIDSGDVSTLAFIIDNSANASDAATSLAFTDTLPVGVEVGPVPKTTNTCGGTVTATAGTGVISLAGGTVAAGASCAINLKVFSATVGAHKNTTGDLTSSLGNSGTATATLTVNAAAPEINLTNGSVFAPQSIADDPAHVPTLGDSTDFGTVALTGGTKQNTFQIENTGTGDLTLDGASPFVVIGGTHAADFTVISNPTTPITAGDRSLFTIRFDPTATGLREATVSIANNDADEDPYNFNIQGTGVVTTAPTFTKVFAPDTIAPGDISTLTFTIDNTANTVVGFNLDFTDNLPAGVLVAPVPNASKTCKNGTITAAAGSGTITFTPDGAVAIGLTCTVSVDVTSAVVGAHLNTSGDLTSDLGNSGTASDTLTVISGDSLTFTKEFTDDPAIPGGTVTLVFTVTNADTLNDATDIAFSDNLDATLSGLMASSALVNTCGGMAGGFPTGNFDYSGGNVTAGGSCTISLVLDVPAGATAGSFPNTTSDLSATIAGLPVTSAPATDTLDVGTAGATAEETQKVIAEFMLNRANHILNNQPSLIDFVTGNNTNGGGPLGNLALDGNTESMNLAFATSRSKMLAAQSGPGSGLNPGIGPGVSSATSGGAPIANPLHSTPMMSFAPATQPGEAEAQLSGLDNNPAINPDTGETSTQENRQTAISTYSDDKTGNWDIWTEVYGSMASAGASESTLWVGYLGTHIFVSPDMLVGILGQLDWADETNSTVNSNADGVGWMIGPYVAGRIPGQNLYYEARAAWGRSDNDVSPIGTYTDGFETERWMALAKLEGAYEIGNLTIKPSARVTWYEETQESYTDTNAVFIPSQTISLGEFRFGPDFVWDILLDDGTLFQPSVGVAGVVNFGIQNNVASQGFALGDDDLRARFEAGFSATNPMGMILSATGFYDGVGINNYYSYGGSVRLTVPLN